MDKFDKRAPLTPGLFGYLEHSHYIAQCAEKEGKNSEPAITG
jgi:hypothetical protein